MTEYIETHYEEDFQLNKTEGRTRAERRKNNHKKIEHKLRYDIYNITKHKPRNAMNKGKNFCSCSMCKPKTNNKGKRWFGRKKITWSSRDWKPSDQVKIDKMDDLEREYFYKPLDKNLLIDYNDDLYCCYDLYHNKTRNTIIQEMIDKDIYIEVKGSYYIEDKWIKYHEEYDINFESLTLSFREQYNDYHLYWLDEAIVEDLEYFIKSKGLNIMCSDIMQGRIAPNIYIEYEPTFSIYKDGQEWIDGTYIHIRLANKHKMFEDVIEEE